mmetsp:Transcript_3321/g.6236  ORF Transcript_3321/g.6236 Transcript_3321/m.6236 type:complete len:144 (+) Transcript_3321:2220-2651(+)
MNTFWNRLNSTEKEVLRECGGDLLARGVVGLGLGMASVGVISRWWGRPRKVSTYAGPVVSPGLRLATWLVMCTAGFYAGAVSGLPKSLEKIQSLPDSELAHSVRVATDDWKEKQRIEEEMREHRKQAKEALERKVIARDDPSV